MSHVLDLFAGLGGFSSAFTESDSWTVTTVDLDSSFETDITADVLDLRPSDLPDVDVVLASPPCTQFSTAGNHDNWDGQTPVGPAREAVTLVYHTLGLIKALSPDYWFLENPRGRLRWFLGQPTGTVDYCQYGRDYQKPTDLWGVHPPMTYKRCHTAAGGGCHVRNAEDDGTAADASMPKDRSERALVPRELSDEILRAVEGVGEQQTLVGDTYV